MKLDTHSQRAAIVLQTMSNKQRLGLLQLLHEKERSVSELTEISGLRQATVSQHLAKLREARLVTTRRQAQSIYYSLSGDEVKTLLETLTTLYGTAHS